MYHCHKTVRRTGSRVMEYLRRYQTFVGSTQFIQCSRGCTITLKYSGLYNSSGLDGEKFRVWKWIVHATWKCTVHVKLDACFSQKSYHQYHINYSIIRTNIKSTHFLVFFLFIWFLPSTLQRGRRNKLSR